MRSETSPTPLHVVLTGASGMIGSQLAASLAAAGHRVLRLVRRAPQGPDEVEWNPASGELPADALEGLDAFVHLSGESLAAGRWTAARRRRIVASRIDSTRLIAQVLATLSRPPRVLLSASAIGYYGDRGGRELDETSPPGTGFLAELCRDWEAAAQPAVSAGVRIVHPRFGVVLSSSGGALARLLPVFRAGLGAPLGSGRQWMSWIALDDALRGLRHLIVDDRLAGAVNLVAPESVTNRDFARSLASALGRPVLLRIPASFVRLALGTMAEETLLASQRVVPRRLQESGFVFARPTLDEALHSVLDV